MTIRSASPQGESAPETQRGTKLATPEKALFDMAYFSGARTRLFAHVPELELPGSFRPRTMERWIERIESLELYIVDGVSGHAGQHGARVALRPRIPIDVRTMPIGQRAVGHRHRTSDRRCSVGWAAAMKYDRTVIAYHGCDAETAERLLRGESFKKSQNDYDWLGEGVYFWEYGADRALRFAHDQQRRGKVKTPAIVGVLLQLGNCFDLMDSRFTDELPGAYAMLQKLHEAQGTPVPENAGSTPDQLLRRRDCAVLNV